MTGWHLVVSRIYLFPTHSVSLTGAAEIMRVSWKTAKTSQTVASLRSFPMRPAIGWAQPASSTLIGWFVVVRPTCWWNVKNTTDVMFVKVWCLDIILMFLRRLISFTTCPSGKLVNFLSEPEVQSPTPRSWINSANLSCALATTSRLRRGLLWLMR